MTKGRIRVSCLSAGNHLARELLKQRDNGIALGWGELMPVRFNNLLVNGVFRRLLHSPLHVLNGIIRVKDAFLFVWRQDHKLLNRLLLLVPGQLSKEFSHHLHLNPGTEIINVPLCFLVGAHNSMYSHENVSSVIHNFCLLSSSLSRLILKSFPYLVFLP